jgi:hypothetical protein
MIPGQGLEPRCGRRGVTRGAAFIQERDEVVQRYVPCLADTCQACVAEHTEGAFRDRRRDAGPEQSGRQEPPLDFSVPGAGVDAGFGGIAPAQRVRTAAGQPGMPGCPLHAARADQRGHTSILTMAAEVVAGAKVPRPRGVPDEGVLAAPGRPRRLGRGQDRRPLPKSDVGGVALGIDSAAHEVNAIRAALTDTGITEHAGERRLNRSVDRHCRATCPASHLGSNNRLSRRLRIPGTFATTPVCCEVLESRAAGHEDRGRRSLPCCPRRSERP